jgi:hypothetical protein
MIDEGKVLTEAFDASGIKFNDRSVALAELKKDGREIAYDDDGKPHVHYDSEILPLSDALIRFGYDRRDLCDGRTLPRTGAGTARPGLMSKADLPDFKAKVAFIREHGEEAYARLPLTGVATSEVLTKSDWYKLNRKEKCRRLDADPDAFNRLPSGPPTIPGALVNRSYVNQPKLDALKKIRH